MKTHHFLRILTVLLLAILLAGCDDEEDKSTSTKGVDTSQHVTTSTIDRANQAAADLAKRVEVEHEMRLQAEARLAQETSARSWWQNATTTLAVVAVAALVIGTALGSSARHESEKA